MAQQDWQCLQRQDAGSIPGLAQWVKGSSIAAAVAQIIAAAQIQSLELPYAMGVAEIGKKEENIIYYNI